MWTKILIALGIIVGVLVLLFVALAWYLYPDAQRVLKFMKNNPDRSAFLLVENDSIIARHEANKAIPLASTVKIVVAVEYAEQAAAGMLNPDEPVALSVLETFYVPKTDGGAHEAWLETLGDKIQNDAVPLREVVRGMIRHSSNANTEWLMAKLGLDRINARTDSLELKQHTPIYYIVSALFVGKEAFPDLKGKALTKAWKKMDMETYIRHSKAIHEKLLTDPAYKTELGDLNSGVQKAWTDKLPAASANDYVSIVQRMNRKSFPPAVQTLLDEVMETMMENSKNAAKFQHAGMKGGSTMSLLTRAMYATDKQGLTIEMTYFLYPLSALEMIRLQSSMSDFEQAVLTDTAFRAQMKEQLGIH